MPELETEFLSKQQVEALVRELIADFVRQNEQRAKELSIIERVIRVEEEIKALREIETARFEAMEKRFEALQREMNARFEAMEKRFEALQREMNARFEAMEKRLTFIQWFIGIGFTFVSILITIFGLAAK
ncbi:hypothetical protein V4D30_08600 [Thermodesulfovibrio sp. 3907-1M]|uniref:DUF1640 domain-containing protein n=1 Tax=Thermodesulfovibrio autotrophicus TaxID=3118333 RepID=A0AAU8GVL2_9BACT